MIDMFALLLARVLQRLKRRRGVFQQIGMAEQTANRLLQLRRAREPLADFRRRLQIKRRQKRAPVIAHDFRAQLALVGFERLRKQAVAVERVLAQHAVAPAMNRGDRGFIHPFRGELQPVRAGGPLLDVVAVTQVVQQVFAGHERFNFVRVRAEIRGRFDQTRTDAVTQLLGGRIRKRHDENFWRRQRPRLAIRSTMTQHEPDVQHRDREGLASAGARFDQAAALQRKFERLQFSWGSLGLLRCQGSIHCASPACDDEFFDLDAETGIARCSGNNNATASVSNSPLAASTSKSG